jgi:hypothetical protein
MGLDQQRVLALAGTFKHSAFLLLPHERGRMDGGA